MAHSPQSDQQKSGPPATAPAAALAPVVVLVRPQLGENIGMAVRAMANCGLETLRLVQPRDGWPNPGAVAAAVGADWILNGVEVFDSTAAAVADLQLVFAATARARDITKDVTTPEGAASAILVAAAEGVRSGILYGPEASGLDNADVALADSILTVPLPPRFTSLNLGMAVLLTGYAWHRAGAAGVPAPQAPPPPAGSDDAPATKGELVALFEHLERELDASGFLHIIEKRPNMVQNLRAIFQRARLTVQEARTLRGVIASLVRYGGNRGLRGAHTARPGTDNR